MEKISFFNDHDLDETERNEIHRILFGKSDGRKNVFELTLTHAEWFASKQRDPPPAVVSNAYPYLSAFHMPPAYHMLGPISSNVGAPAMNLQQNDGQQFPQYPTVFRGHPQPIFISPQYPHLLYAPQFISAIPSPHYVVPPNSAGATFSPYVAALHGQAPPFMVPLTICNNVQPQPQPIVQLPEMEKETTVNHSTCIVDVPSIVSPTENCDPPAPPELDEESNGERTEQETVGETDNYSIPTSDNAPAPAIDISPDTGGQTESRVDAVSLDEKSVGIYAAAQADTQPKRESSAAGDRSLPVAQNHAVQDSQAIPNNNPENSSRCQEKKSWASLFQNTTKTAVNK